MKSLFLVFLIALVSCQKQYKFADIVYVVDEGVPRETLMWVNGSVWQIEKYITNAGIGNESNMTNLYSLILFGNGQNPRRVLSGNLELATAQVFNGNLSNAISNLSTPATIQNHDGYAALYLALQTMWRAGSIRVIIFVTDRERDVVSTNLSREILATKMSEVQVNFNAILNISISGLVPTSNSSGNNTIARNPALGVVFANDSSFAYYLSPSSNKVETTPFSSIVGTNATSSVVFDYVFLSELLGYQVYSPPVPSSVWQLSYTQNNNASFNDAFFNSTVFEIQRTSATQVLCQACQGNNCYYLPTRLVIRSEANNLCMSRGGELASLSDQNAVNTLRNLFGDVFWINSFQNNTNGCLAMIGNNVTSVLCNEEHFALCQIPRSGLIGC